MIYLCIFRFTYFLYFSKIIWYGDNVVASTCIPRWKFTERHDEFVFKLVASQVRKNLFFILGRAIEAVSVKSKLDSAGSFLGFVKGFTISTKSRLKSDGSAIFFFSGIV